MSVATPEELDELCDWSGWIPLSEARKTAPLQPGVYLAREHRIGPIVYVGSAGERAGRAGTKKPQGIRGRLRVYTSGKAMTSGLGETLADRAFADATWLSARLREVESGKPRRSKEWGVLTVERADLYVRWCVTADKASAELLETQCGRILRTHGLWNRKKFS